MERTAQNRIQKFLKFGSKLGLERMEGLCEALGHPERMQGIVHVAGTNGKGSVCRYLYETLLALGYSAGIFTSPYVEDFRERIEANGEMIPEDILEGLTDEVLGAAEILTTERDETPTEFEIITAIGLAYFASLKLDFVILEVGLGGRGDSTNIIENPLCTVITQISFDHMDRLGNTLEEIAAEKAGILKPGRPLVTGAAGEAAKVIARRAYELGVPLIDTSKIKAYIHEKSAEGSRFSAVIGGNRYDNIEISMAGAHQVDNAVVALCVLEQLRSQKQIAMDGEALRRGMKKARLPARFQIFSREPLIIFDGAHNSAGARALADTLIELYPASRILFVTAVLRDKEAEKILREFARAAAGFAATDSSSERSLSARELAGKIRAAGGSLVFETAGARDALEKAKAMAAAGDFDLIVCAGSLYMIGDILK
ncbi:MAG: bifunctional folylpolyglutamate synthase/dihydrofolate synthase [Clostridiales Family XIII bacterium]|jgi:dihydrofolate synthase/folylpolyglutamate synthase|nr:bifunctional folylpolyglutamate synthase/dihydrofolate synthase [Clostridiales Family XIII bacterium]